MPTLTINVAGRGTAMTTGGTSQTGHMWFTGDNGKGSVQDYGFHPALDGKAFYEGHVSNDDSNLYYGKEFSQTFTLTEAQYAKVKAWADATVINGWGNYNGLNHNCIDFTWEALTQAGINKNPSEDGFFWPSGNNSRLKELMYDYYRQEQFNREGRRKKIEEPHDKFWDARDYANRNYSPIILDLNNDGIIGSTNVRKQHTNFDFDGKNTILEGTAWIDANDGFLVLDKNNNGKIDNGSELFGDNTLLSNGKTAKDGGYNNQINLPHTFLKSMAKS